jgi:prenylated cyclic peptide (anacyclamide/piricyclamide family)
MTKKNLKPKQAAPVQRENTATVARDGNAIAPWILLRATTRSNPHNSNTHLKKCQKSFSTCHGARFASMN